MSRVKSIPLGIGPRTLPILEQGLIGYVFPSDGHFPCHLLGCDGRSVEVTVVGTDVAPRFECFSLALSVEKPPVGQVIAFATRSGAIPVCVLLREEYIEPFTGDASKLQLRGQPSNVQSASKPGEVPSHALASCLVAYGLLIEGLEGRLAVVADWFPFRISVTRDETEISAHLAVSDVVPLARYAEAYGVS